MAGRPRLVQRVVHIHVHLRLYEGQDDYDEEEDDYDDEKEDY